MTSRRMMIMIMIVIMTIV